MALFNHATKEVTAKLVYYGPGLCGKTTNLQWIHDNLTFENKGKLISLATQTDRTLFFDFLPVELGTIRGMRTRMQIYTVPGQVFYEATRRMVLKGCDAVVFVADSQAAMLDANFESLQSLRRNLLANEIDPAIPMVLQYNKRDLPTALPVSVLNARLNPRNLPFFESVAFQGPGVEDTLRGITKALFKWLSDYYAGTEKTTARKAARPAPAPQPAPSEPQTPGKVTVRLPQPTVRFQPTADAPAPEATATATVTPPPPAPTPTPVPPRAATPAPVKTAPVTPATTPRTPPAPARFSPPPAPVAPPKPPTRTETSPPVAKPTARTPPPTPRPAPAAPPPAPATPRATPPEAETPEAAATIILNPEALPAPSAEPTPSAPAGEDAPGAAETFVFVEPDESAEMPPEELGIEILPDEPLVEEEELPATIRIQKQKVVISDAPREAPAATAAPPPAAESRSASSPAPAVAPTPAPAPSVTPAPPAPPVEPAVFSDSPKQTAPSDPPPQGAGLSENQWLYLLDGSQKGPIDIEDLVDLVLTSLPEDTKVWHTGLEGWVLANEAREIAAEIPPPLPIPGAARGGIVEEEMPDFDTVPPQFRTALIADEDEAFRKYLAMPLAAQGFTILEAADGSAAWQLAVQHRPWLILADVSMPEVDGFEFCRRVRSHPLLSHTPLLFISGSDKYKERYRALQIGADDFLSKQMPIRELLMRIQLLLTKYSDLSDQQEAKKEGEKEGAFEGRIEVFGAPALLQMCAQGRLSGLFTVLAEDEANTAATMGFRDGDIVSATVGAQSGLDAAYAFLTWAKGSFQFTPGDPGEAEPLAQSVEHLLLEGCRLMDESARDGDEAGGLL